MVKAIYVFESNDVKRLLCQNEEVYSIEQKN